MLSGGNRDPSSRFTPRYTGCPRTVVAPFTHGLLDSAAAGVARRDQTRTGCIYPNWHPINSLIITFQKWLTSINIPFNPPERQRRYVRCVRSEPRSRIGRIFSTRIRVSRPLQRRCRPVAHKLAIIVAVMETRYARFQCLLARKASGCERIIRRRDRREKGSMLREPRGRDPRPAGVKITRRDIWRHRHMQRCVHICGHVAYIASTRASRLRSLAHVLSPVAADEAKRWIRSPKAVLAFADLLYDPAYTRK